MAKIEWTSTLNGDAGFFVPTDHAQKLSPSDKNTLLHLIWSLTYTEEGRKLLKENRPKKPAAGVPGVTPDLAAKNLRKWIQANIPIPNATVVDAIISAHLAADAWIDAHGRDDFVERDRQEKIYQQNIAVVTWMLWEDAMAHEFSMNW